MTIILMVVGWIVCGIVAAGGFFADLQGRYPQLAVEDRRSDLASSLFLGLAFGPISLAISVFVTGFYEHGWRLRWK